MQYPETYQINILPKTIYSQMGVVRALWVFIVQMSVGVDVFAVTELWKFVTD